MASGTPLEGALTEQEQNWVIWYKGWCHSVHRVVGDCLGGALVAGKYMDLRGRYMWAMAMSKSPVLEEFEKALGEMVSMQAVMQAAMGTLVVLLVLLTLPEPVTKFIAAWAATALILWVGAKTLYKLITGWFQLMKEVQAATTFEQVRDAGERFGRLFSREAAQAFAASSSARWRPRRTASAQPGGRARRTAPSRAGGARPQLGSAETGQGSAPGEHGASRSQGSRTRCHAHGAPNPGPGHLETHGDPVACARTAAPRPAPPASAAATRAPSMGARAGKRVEQP